MFSSLERYIPLFEAYLTSNNKTDFISSRNDPNEKTLLELLTSPITSIQQFQEKMQKVNLNHQLQRQIIDYRLYSYVQNAKDLKSDLLFMELKKKYSNGNFEFSRPAVLNAEEPKKGQEKPSDTEVTLPDSLGQYLESKRKTNPAFLSSINDYAFSKLSEETLLALSVSDKEFVLDKFATIFHLRPEFVSKFLIQLENQKRKATDSYRLPNKILSCLTKDQLLALEKQHKSAFLNEDFIELWFNQRYAETIRRHVENSSLFTKTEHSQKRDAFKKIVAELKHYNHYQIINRYTNKLSSQILVLDTLVNDPELDRLVNYLKTSSAGLQLSNIQKRFYDECRTHQKQLIQEPRFRYKLQVDKTSPDAFVEEYIELLFKNTKQSGEPIIQTLRQFFQESYLRKINARVRLYKGELIENINDYFNQQEIQAMKDRREIRLLPSNPKKYKVEDDVVLDVSIKNVKKISIKVYVLNLEKHLLGDSCNYLIDDEIQLSFLNPTAQDEYENRSSNPFEVIQTKIDLSKIIPKAMGVYIVDFQGETVTSRAVIRKGAIICIDTLTEAGQQFSFFNQNGRPLAKQDGLRVWIRGQITQLIGNKAFVTYADKSEYGTIVASVGDYAQSFQKNFEEQHYNLNLAYIYNTESFIVGRKAKIIIHGRLAMNDKSMSLELLRNIKTTVTVTNNQDIKTTYTFQFDKWSNYEDQVIEFPIQAYTKQISLLTESQITLQNKKDANFSNSKDINIDLGEGSTNFLDFYLEQDAQKNYRLSLLGANGEAISNADIILSFNINGVNDVERKQVKTNSEGQVNLRHLSIVSRLTAEINNSDSNFQRSWLIDQTAENLNYNNTIHFKLGQSLTLPISKNWTKGDVLLLRTFDKYYSGDLTDKLIFDNGTVTIPAINEQGFYILKLLPIDKTIEIVTLKNHQWQDDNVQNQKVYDEAEGTVYEINKNIYQNIAIQSATFTQRQDHIDAALTLNLNDLPEDRLKDVRIHILANNFLSADVRDTFKTDGFNVQAQLGEHYIKVKKSAYYSNKTFSEEGAYVWNRQSKNEQLIGNNLEKPSIFLKRILVRETNQNNEELYDQGKYIEECALMDIDPNIREKFKARRGQSLKMYAAGNTLNLNSHNNFLLLSGDISKNLNGKQLHFQIPLGYSSIEAYVLTPKTALKNTFSLGLNQIHRRKDLRHIGLEQTEENFGWTMSREINPLKAGEKRIVSRDSQWRTVGLTDIFQFAKNKKIKLYDWSTHLTNWHTYSQQKKKEIYDKQCCHELNTFIKFKDATFFEDVVRAFIKNKIQKNIVDLCLLNDPSYINFTALNELSKLNAFEKALLVYALTQNEKIDIATSIVQSMELLQKSIKRNYQQDKNNFDTIINAKLTEIPQPSASMLESNRRNLMEMKSQRMYRMVPQMEQQRCRMDVRMDIRKEKMQEKKAFVPIESTKQYTERTYYNVKDYRSQAPRLVPASRFWAEVARSFLNKTTVLVTQAFMSLKTPIDFMLASCFISSESSSNFEISNSGQNYEVYPKSSMLLYVKEVKKLQYLKKFGVLINQRFFDPKNRKAYDQDGTEYEKEVEEFIVKKCYVCQTVINNTSGTPLELQVLLDIPRGTIPIKSHEYTQIINIRINPYSSQSYERLFYIPEVGQYEIYPSNAARGSTIIAKANQIPPIIVKKVWTINKLQSLEDILRSGDKKKVIQFLEKRNIFDSNVFRPHELLWMLKDQEFYYQVIDILRRRSFFDQNIWEFAFLHIDLQGIKEIVNQKSTQGVTLAPISFEYFPYYSSRTHQFANESKSTIRNVQFKQTYLRFLLGSIIGLKFGSFEVSYCYYLILQDRLREANDIIKNLAQDQYRAYQIQFDYMKCFLDLSLNAPTFSTARETIKKYENYPVQSWKKLFDEVKTTIATEENDFAAEIDHENVEAFQTQVIQEPGQFKVIQPAETTIVVQIFEINLELYFSEYPFIEIKTFTSVKPSKVHKIEASKESKENIIKRSDFQGLKDATVEITEFKAGLPPKKVSTFWWTNPDIKVKVNENEGTLQVYLNKKRHPGSYIKVFSDKGFAKDFYRDGYTDMTGTFRYAMSDLDGIKEFSILVMTEKGGIIQKVQPPSKLGSF